VLAVITSLFGAFYYLRIVKLMYFDAPQDSAPIVSPAANRWLLTANGVAVLVLGIVPGPLMTLCMNAIAHTLPRAF
jgi:NADH-quinone oxidoreductase subunit N